MIGASVDAELGDNRIGAKRGYAGNVQLDRQSFLQSRGLTVRAPANAVVCRHGSEKNKCDGGKEEENSRVQPFRIFLSALQPLLRNLWMVAAQAIDAHRKLQEQRKYQQPEDREFDDPEYSRVHDEFSSLQEIQPYAGA